MLVDPVFAEPPHLYCGVGPLQAWFTKPAGAVLQLSEASVFTRAMAAWVADDGFAALCAHYPDVGSLKLVFDIRPLSGREPAARTLLMEAGQKYIQRFDTVVIVAPHKPPPLYMTTLLGAAALLSAFGSDVSIVNSIEEALQRYGLTSELSDAEPALRPQARSRSRLPPERAPSGRAPGPRASGENKR